MYNEGVSEHDSAVYLGLGWSTKTGRQESYI